MIIEQQIALLKEEEGVMSPLTEERQQGERIIENLCIPQDGGDDRYTSKSSIFIGEGEISDCKGFIEFFLLKPLHSKRATFNGKGQYAGLSDTIVTSMIYPVAEVVDILTSRRSLCMNTEDVIRFGRALARCNPSLYKQIMGRSTANYGSPTVA